MKKRILPLILALVLALAMLAPAGAFGMSKAGQRTIISAGGDHTAVVDSNGSLWAWGNDRLRAVGSGEGGLVTYPAGILNSVTAISAGGSHTAAIKADGSLWVWGSNQLGQLGIGKGGYVSGNIYTAATPVKVMTGVAAVSCGEGHTAAIKTDGSLWVWGGNGYGQLGNGTVADALSPIKLMNDVAAVSCGNNHTAALKTDGSLWVWGNNNAGAVGNNGVSNKTIEVVYNQVKIQTLPVKVMDDVVSMCCGNNFTAAIKADGTLWMWGTNGSGQLGNGGKGNSSIGTVIFGLPNTSTPIQTVPTQVLEDVAFVSCGTSHAAVVKTDGTLWTWGNNIDGQLGNGTTTSAKYPVKLMDNIATVSCGDYHTLALKNDGTLWTWGNNQNGALGVGDAANDTNVQDEPIQTVPIQVGSLILPLGVRLHLNGGIGVNTLWTPKDGELAPPINPTKAGYSFGGWYIDPELTTPWNFDMCVYAGLNLYAGWIPLSSTAETTGKSNSSFVLDGKPVSIEAYTLKADSNGGDVTFVKLRDVAMLINGTPAQCNVDWKNGAIRVLTRTPYTTQNGTELKPIQGAGNTYKINTSPILFDGVTAPLEGIVITDGNGGGHTFFKLRDLGKAIGFNVGWNAEIGIYIETDKPYSGT